MPKFSVWEILLDHFEIDHNEKCWEYLDRNPPTEKLVIDFAYEFHLCPGISNDELHLLTEHFKQNSELVERIAYAKIFSEEAAIRLLDGPRRVQQKPKPRPSQEPISRKISPPLATDDWPPANR